MKSKPIIRMFIFILTIINVIFYPIGLALTNPDFVNRILDSVNAEKYIIDAYEKILLSKSDDEDTQFGELPEDVSTLFVKEEKLREQRRENIGNFFDAISKKEVPKLKFELLSPVSSIKYDIKNFKGDILDSIDDLSDECENSNSIKCTLLNGFKDKLNNITDDEAASGSRLKDILVIETSFGVTKQNIDQIYTAYRVLKYGPEALLVFTLALMILGYAFSLPNREYSKKLIYEFIKADFFALIFWLVIPQIFRGLSPIRISSNFGADLTDTINDGIAGVLFELGKYGILLPVGLTLLSVLIYVVILAIARISKNVDDISSTGKGIGEEEGEGDESENNQSQIKQEAVVADPDKGTTVWSSKKRE